MTLQDDNKALIGAYHQRLWGQGDLSVIDQVWHPEAKVSLTDFADTALSAVKADAERYFGAFSEVATTIHTLLAEGDKVVLHRSTAGRHIGPYGEIAATGRTITMAGIDILTVQDGRIVAADSMWDGLSVFDQLGVLAIGTVPAP